MKKSKKKILCLLLAGIMLFGMTSTTAFAEADAVEVFDVVTTTGTGDTSDWSYGGNNSISTYASTPMITKVFLGGVAVKGGFSLTASVWTNETATSIGVKDILVQKQTSAGWINVASSSGGSVTDASTYSCSGLVTSLEAGQTYRITATHYATLSNGYTQVPHISDSFVYVPVN